MHRQIPPVLLTVAEDAASTDDVATVAVAATAEFLVFRVFCGKRFSCKMFLT